VSPTPSARTIAFAEVVSTAQARDDGGPTLLVGTSDASSAKITQLVPGATVSAGRVMIAVFQGQQSTGGYTVHITAVERSGDQLVVRATFTRPVPGAIVTQVLTAPAQVVSIDATAAAGLHVAVLLDENGAEVARTDTT
jgi:hypothetical protein